MFLIIADNVSVYIVSVFCFRYGQILFCFTSRRFDVRFDVTFRTSFVEYPDTCEVTFTRLRIFDIRRSKSERQPAKQTKKVHFRNRRKNTETYKRRENLKKQISVSHVHYPRLCFSLGVLALSSFYECEGASRLNPHLLEDRCISLDLPLHRRPFRFARQSKKL